MNAASGKLETCWPSHATSRTAALESQGLSTGQRRLEPLLTRVVQECDTLVLRAKGGALSTVDDSETTRSQQRLQPRFSHSCAPGPCIGLI